MMTGYTCFMSFEPRHSHVPAGDGTLHVAETGDPDGRPFLFLHGWPESWRTWAGVLAAAAPEARAIAVDLPGIGASTATTDGTKTRIAACVHELVRALGLADLTLAGHDAGGMAAYAYLRRYADVARVVVMNTVLPGVPPWSQVIANPYIWHFGLHAVPELPETLVRGRQAAYFAYFHDVLSADPARITAESRAAHAEAYASGTALTAGFDLYRAFPADAAANEAAAAGPPVATPLLYLRGAAEHGDITMYADGLRAAGVTDVTTAVIPGAGHFAQEESPEEVWRLIRDFAAR